MRQSGLPHIPPRKRNKKHGSCCTCDHLRTWHDGFLAVVALGGILIGVALGAEELLILGGEGLVHQRALALEALEAVLVPVAVLVGQILQSAANGRSEFARRLISFSKLLFIASSALRPRLPWNCSQWASCTPRRCWSTGSRSISHSRDSPLSGRTSSHTGTPCSSGSRSARSC